jgi:DNA-binding MarR family transcriptional regulator
MISPEINKTAEDILTAYWLLGTLFRKEDIDYSDSELTRSHYELLYLLLGNNTAWGKVTLTMSEIAKALSLSKPYVTALVDRLIAKEFITRSADHADRRIIKITMTGKGLQETLKNQRSVQNSIALKIAKLSKEELQQLTELVPTMKYLFWRVADNNRTL